MSNEPLPNQDRSEEQVAQDMGAQVAEGFGLPRDTFHFPWPRKPLGKPTGKSGAKTGGKSAARGASARSTRSGRSSRSRRTH